MRRLRIRSLFILLFAIIILAAFICAVLAGAVYYRNSRISRIASVGLEIRGGILRGLANRSIEVGCRNPLWWSVSHSNEEGFRDEMLDQEENFIGIFGDSYVGGDCLRDSETIDSQLESALRAGGREYKVYNFGIRGYNLNSSLRALDEMSREYRMVYAVVYFLPDDDMFGHDISYQYAVQKEDPNGYARLLENLTRDYEVSHSSYISLIRKGFDNLIDKELVEKGTLNRTRVVFYVFNTDAESEQSIESALDGYNISHIAGGRFQECQGLLKPCAVWLDGHPSAFYNRLIAGQISGYLAAKVSS